MRAGRTQSVCAASSTVAEEVANSQTRSSISHAAKNSFTRWTDIFLASFSIEICVVKKRIDVIVPRKSICVVRFLYHSLTRAQKKRPPEGERHTEF
jgi:hypothetical protein